MKRRSPTANQLVGGVKPGGRIPPGRGRATGSFVGTGVNDTTKARPEYQGSRPRSGVNAQAEDWITQSPSPFDSNVPSSNPRSYQTGPEGATFQKGAGISGHAPMAQSAMNTATGHGAGYKPANQSGNPLISGYPKKTSNQGDAGSQPQASKGKRLFSTREYQKAAKIGGILSKYGS